MKCPNCKNTVRKGSLFCPHCGNSIKKKSKKKRVVFFSAICFSVSVVVFLGVSFVLKNNSIVGKWTNEYGQMLVFHYDGSFEDSDLRNEYGSYDVSSERDIFHGWINWGTYQLLNDDTLVLSYNDTDNTRLTFMHNKDWHLSPFGKLHIGNHTYSRKTNPSFLKKDGNNESVFDAQHRGASSLEEIKKILNDTPLFSPEQVRCMSADMVLWLCDPYLQTDFTEKLNVDLTNKGMSALWNELLEEADISASIKIDSLNNIQSISSSSISFTGLIGAELNALVCDGVRHELGATSSLGRGILNLLWTGALENAWIAEGTFTFQCAGKTYPCDLTKNNIAGYFHNDAYDPYYYSYSSHEVLDLLLIYKIGGRYYWSSPGIITGILMTNSGDLVF